MKKFAATLCIAGTAIALSACETGSTHHSGASYANERTAGEVETMAPAQPAPAERVFREYQTK
ncbi:MAG: hypothetical protein H6861_09395 [Rhodospirillales bacterium]|nr:hypothetical protein [Rhodospirillales bacterium]